jgi:hypothetical protein
MSSNPGRRGGNSATNRLSYGTAFPYRMSIWCVNVFLFSSKSPSGVVIACTITCFLNRSNKWTSIYYSAHIGVFFRRYSMLLIQLTEIIRWGNYAKSMGSLHERLWSVLLYSGMWRRVVCYKFAVILKERKWATTRCHISDDNNLLTHRCENRNSKINGYSQASKLMYFTGRCGSHVISMHCTNTSQIKHCTKALHIVLINK